MAFKAFYRRRFLNRRGHHAGAYAIAECKVATYRGKRELDAYLTLADCNRVVSLDLSGSSASEINNAVLKAQHLRRIVNDLCSAVEAAADEVASHRAGTRESAS